MEPDFIKACRGEAVDRVPVWFMRQAGRSLPEYRALRATGSILDAIASPELAAEVTLQPVRRYGVDAAILFSDIVVPFHAIDFGIDVVPGRGPVIAEPFATEADLLRLRQLEEDDISYVTDTIDCVIKELKATDTPLIGFAGAPFTVASYLVEGAPTREFTVIKTMMHRDPELFDKLLDRLVEITIAFLRAQVSHGARAIQLFDSWAGSLTKAEYERYALPATQRVFEGIADLNVPTILFGVGTGELLSLMAGSGCSVVGIDWHVDLDDARRRVGERPVQGNLDPARCLAGEALAIEATREVLAKAGTAPGHVFNLGHGVLPATDPDVLAAVVRVVHEE
ncbi:MAG TPA: uroporphyrinogen decarboxylase, partial [Acidimicrobiales bacterium]|nr:uroporphyrinogen decarboxylase [Acidimicrobiales bacterium]